MRSMEGFTRAERYLSVLIEWSGNWRAVMWARDKQRRCVTLLSIFTVVVVTGKEPSNS